MVLYVDDLVITINNVNLILGLKKQLANTFEMTDLGLLHFFLGIQILQMDDGIFLSQPKYALDILKRFKMDDCKSYATPSQSRSKLLRDCDSPRFNTTLYQQLIVILISFMHCPLDLSFVVSFVSRFMQGTRVIHSKEKKWIVSYIKATYQYCNNTYPLVGYTNSDWGGDIVDRKSTSGYVFQLSFRPLVWSIKKQKIVSLSNTKVEYCGVDNVGI